MPAPHLPDRLDLFSLFEPPEKPIFGQCLRAGAEGVALQFLDDLPQSSVLGLTRKQHGFESVQVVGSTSAVIVMERQQHDPAAKTRVWMRLIQLLTAAIRPSAGLAFPAARVRAFNLARRTMLRTGAAVRRIAQSCILGQWNSPSSSCLDARHTPLPSRNTSLIRPLVLPRTRRVFPENGRGSSALTSTASPSAPLWKSIGRVATMIFAAPDGRITVVPRCLMTAPIVAASAPAPVPALWLPAL